MQPTKKEETEIADDFSSFFTSDRNSDILNEKHSGNTVLTASSGVLVTGNIFTETHSVHDAGHRHVQWALMDSLIDFYLLL